MTFADIIDEEKVLEGYAEFKKDYEEYRQASRHDRKSPKWTGYRNIGYKSDGGLYLGNAAYNGADGLPIPPEVSYIMNINNYLRQILSSVKVKA